MSLKNAILNNWKTDIVGFAHSISELDSQYLGWTVKFSDSYGVAIPYSGNENINEFFSNAHIKSDTLVESNGSEQRAIILTADFSVAEGPFSTLCEELLSPGEMVKSQSDFSVSGCLVARMERTPRKSKH